MSSKTSKIGCQYTYKQGEKNGEKCGKTCRGKFCFMHKPKSLKKHNERNKKNYKQKIEKKREEEMSELEKKINEMPIDKLPDFNVEDKRRKNLYSELLYQQKKLIGINLFLDIDQKKEIEDMETRLFGKCKCVQLTKDDITKKQIKKFWKDKEASYYCDNDEEAIDKILQLKYCLKCDKYEVSECKYCNRPIGKLVYFPYDGSKEQAKKKLQSILKKKSRLIEKIQKKIMIIKIIEKRLKENTEI